MSLIELIEGPFWTFSASLFVIFVFWRLVSILDLRRRGAPPKPQGSRLAGAIRALVVRFVPRSPFTHSGRVWFTTLAGYAFHLGLFVLLLAAVPHVEFIEKRIVALPWEPISRTGFIIAAEISFLGLIMLYTRRFVDPLVRKISRPDDHIASLLTFIVMLTGCMALGRQSVFLRGLHMGLVELWLIYFPFSSLMHTFTWPISRLVTGWEAGRRAVRW